MSILFLAVKRYPEVVKNEDLKRLASRDELVSTLRRMFPHLSAADASLSPIRGGRTTALAALAQVKPKSYAGTRNYLDGDVTRLSAHLRHGVLTLAEVRDEALRRVANSSDAGKLINEFAWRDYWQRLYFQIGEGIWKDRESLKTGFLASTYSEVLSEDIVNGETSLACMDGFAHELTETGYLHNHARMWFAAFVVHWRRIRWQAGAAWFLEHLVDGDPASNNLSWQWVASTFSSKPYIFNRENLERYTSGVYCRACPHAQARTCPFDFEYESLEQKLFPRLNANVAMPPSPEQPRRFTPSTDEQRSPQPHNKPLLWIHTDSLNPDSPMLTKNPESPAVFIWDLDWLRESKIALKRIVFLAECLQEMPSTMELRVGAVADELMAAAVASGVDYILAQRTPDPRLQAAAAKVERRFPVIWYDPPPFVEAVRTFDLKRFSRYWQRAQTSAMEPTRST